MKIFVISLLSATERRRSIQEQFEKHNLDFEFIDAVDGRQLTEAELAEVCDLNAVEAQKRWLTKGAIGCALSHYKVYKEIIKRNLDYALVLEDDICLQKDFEKIIELLPNHIGENEILLLYYLSWFTLQLDKQTKQDVTNSYALYQPVNLKHPITAAAYVITHMACRSMVNSVMPINCAADDWIILHARGGFDKLRCLYPRLVDTFDYKSTIDYIEADGLFGKFLSYINKEKIFPFYQLTVFRRRLIKKRLEKVLLN